MNDTGHTSCIDRLMNLYSVSNDTRLKAIYDYFNLNTNQINGVDKKYIESIKDGILGADYPSSHEFNDLVSVTLQNNGNLIIAAITNAISAWQNDNPNDMASRLYHFRHHSTGEGVSMWDDPITKPVLLGLSLIDPVYAGVTIVLEILKTCPACLGTGSGAVSIGIGIPNNPFGDCIYCGGDGQVLEELITEVQEIVSWVSGCNIITAFGSYPDLVMHRFKSAEEMYVLHRQRANSVRLNGITLHPSHKSLMYFGYAMHFLEDISTIPHHSLGIPYSNGHANYEAQISYINILNSITWQSVENEYNRIKAAINFQMMRFGQTRTSALFRVVSAVASSLSLSDTSQFAKSAVTLLAALHYCFEDYYESTQIIMKPQKISAKKLFETCKIGLLASNVYTHPTVKKEIIKKHHPVNKLSNVGVLKTDTEKWYKSVLQAAKNNKPMPDMPLVYSNKPIVISRKRINISKTLGII